MRTLKLNAEIFEEHVVLEAVKAYTALASITVSLEDGYYVCTMNRCLYDEDLTVCEFENYAIDLMNSRAR